MLLLYKTQTFHCKSRIPLRNIHSSQTKKALSELIAKGYSCLSQKTCLKDHTGLVVESSLSEAVS